MDKLSRQVKDLETKLHNFMNEYLEQKKAQIQFNTDIIGKVMSLGQKVFPELFDKDGLPLPPVKKEEPKIIVPGDK